MIVTLGERFRANRMLVMQALPHDVAVLACLLKLRQAKTACRSTSSARTYPPGVATCRSNHLVNLLIYVLCYIVFNGHSNFLGFLHYKIDSNILK